MSGHKLLIYVLGLGLLLGAALSAVAETAPGKPAAAGSPAAKKPVTKTSSDNAMQVEPKQPKIVKVSGTLRHGKTIEVTLRNHEDFLRDNPDLTKYVLYVDSIEIVKEAGLVHGNTLVFNIDNKKVPKDAWGKIARCFAEKESVFKPMATAEVGYGQKDRIQGESDFTLHYIEPWEFWLFLAIYAVLLVVFIYLAVTTAVLRDPTGKVKEVRKRTFSLGKSQMAFWFFIVLPAFFFIWLITGSTASLTGSTLILLSISSLTTLISGYVGKNKEEKKEAERPELEQKKGDLEARLIEIKNALPAATPEEKARLQGEHQAAKEKVNQIISLLSPAPPATAQGKQKKNKQGPEVTQGFIKDILRDTYGINLHRLQCAVWTLVMGYIFISSTICSLTMPEFSNTLLALLGISNGTYVALKVPEK